MPPALLLVAAVVARLPALINARGVNSDAAVVGLQAMHILRGEWSWFPSRRPGAAHAEECLPGVTAAPFVAAVRLGGWIAFNGEPS